MQRRWEGEGRGDGKGDGEKGGNVVEREEEGGGWEVVEVVVEQGKQLLG